MKSPNTLLPKLASRFTPSVRKKGGFMYKSMTSMVTCLLIGTTAVAWAESLPSDAAALVLAPVDGQTSTAPSLNDPTKPIESIQYKKTESKTGVKIKILDVQIISYKPNGGSFVV